jgi:hypothetical protein
MDQRLSVRSQTLKILEKNKGKTLEDIDIWNYFLDRMPIAQKMNKK